MCTLSIRKRFTAYLLYFGVNVSALNFNIYVKCMLSKQNWMRKFIEHKYHFYKVIWICAVEKKIITYLSIILSLTKLLLLH